MGWLMDEKNTWWSQNCYFFQSGGKKIVHLWSSEEKNVPTFRDWGNIHWYEKWLELFSGKWTVGINVLIERNACVEASELVFLLIVYL